MLFFLLLWLIATAIIFSIEIVICFYWYESNLDLINEYNTELKTQFHERYFSFSHISGLWFQIIIFFLIGLLIGWYSEKKFKLLEKLNISWQKKQPEFYRNTKGEYRVFLPWLIAELPLLIISLINIVILLVLDTYNYFSIVLLTFTLGIICGQGVEISKRYLNIMEMDRPETAPKSVIEKINPKLNLKNKLLMGQLYTKIVVPFFCFFLLLFIPRLFIIIPNYDDRKLAIILVSILIGITLRWQKELNNSSYFNKINLFNILFINIKTLFLIISILISVLVNNNIYLIVLISILSGFLLPWHPEKLRK